MTQIKLAPINSGRFTPIFGQNLLRQLGNPINLKVMNAISEFLCSLTPTNIIDLDPGEYLFHKNDLAKGIFVINSGRVKLIRDSVDGSQVIIHIAQAHDSLAEASLFSNHYHCHAKSDSQSQIYLYDKKQVLTYLSTDSSMSLNFIEVLAKQIQKLRLLIELRGTRSPRKRFMQYLQIMVNSERSLQIESTYKDLAITLGMSHESLYRVLGQLEKEDVITRDGNRIILSV